MKKISRVDAYSGMDEMDFKVMKQEQYLAFHSNERKESEMTEQFFLDASGDIVLEMYWDSELIHTVRFKNKGVLTKEQ